MTSPANASVQRSSGGGLAEVVELILDKGLVIDAYVRISLVGIELITIDARIVIASVDTYLRFAEATNRLDLSNNGSSSSLLGGRSDDLPDSDRRVEPARRPEIATPYDYDDEDYEERPRRRREALARGEREP